MKRDIEFNCMLKQNHVSSPIGPWNVIACDLGLHSVKLSDEVTNDNFLVLGSEHVSLREKTNNNHIQDFEVWTQNYFGHVGNFNLLQNSPTICEHVIPTNAEINFRQRAWLILKENVVYGKTISYGNLAKLCSDNGKSSAASRAIGGAMANNPLSLIVPCHRVVKADGSAGNYSKRTKNRVKIWLLNHEQK